MKDEKTLHSYSPHADTHTLNIK